jgi:hypothetical protein
LDRFREAHPSKRKCCPKYDTNKKADQETHSERR